ncbi:zinc finger protein 423 homolog [Prorops nasuta]|uniref:zinc finger protein 423 homolog n=1 Tax=Prorops nasuta TaxID=863751 RepID=UPI0034CE0B2B
MLFKGNSSRLELLIGKIQAHKEPSHEEARKTKEVLGTGSSSWHSEDGARTSSRRTGGVETPSSCATPTSASFPSEPEADTDLANNPTAPYPCQFCERTFPRLSYLKKHEQSHGDQMPYRCSWCARLFKHKRSRDRHVKLHTGDRRYRCSHCEAAFSRSDHLKIHMKTHDTQKPYQCTACSRGYNTAAALTSHMQSHKKSSSGKAMQEQDYGRRSASSHSTSSPPVVSSPSPSLNLSLGLNPKVTTKSPHTSRPAGPILCSPLKLACMYCTRDSFSCMQQLQLHVQTMHQTILSGEALSQASLACGKISDRQEAQDCQEKKLYSKDQKKSSQDEGDRYDGSLSCSQCTMKFSTLSSLKDHLLSIHRTDPTGFASTLMMCPLCGIPCSSSAAYAEHYVLQHCDNRMVSPSESRETNDNESKDSSIRRSRSDKSSQQDSAISLVPNSTNPVFNESQSLHPRSSGSEINAGYSSSALLCGQCGAALKDFESFREHLARHLQADYRNEVARYPCPKCEAMFQDREDMLAHLTKHYLGQTTKEYVCGACKRLYPHPDLLQRHLLDSHAHHLYRCALCRDTFDSKVAIQVHFAVKHSQECRVFKCNGCPNSNNENLSGNAPAEGRTTFRSEAEIASHVRAVHAPASMMSASPVGRSPASTPGVPTTSGPRCVFCGICCGSELELQLHLPSHSISLYRCPICREGFAVEFLLDRHITQVHQTGEHRIGLRNNPRENGRIHRPVRSQEESQIKSQSLKRGRSPASSNNNSLNHRDNNNKRFNYGSGQQCELCDHGEFANEAELQAHKKLVHPMSKAPNKSSLSSLSMSCAYCGEVCRSRSELESHTKMQHASNEPGGRHKCNICDEVCPSGGLLAEHKLQKHCKIQLSDTCVVCRGNLPSEATFLEHVQRHSLENVDSQQRLDSSFPQLPAACVVCRQTLTSELECRLHAKHHLRPSTRNQNSSSSPSPNPKSQSCSCCLCMRDLSSEDYVNVPSSHANASGHPLRVCKPCYVRHSQGHPILGLPYDHLRAYKTDRSWIPDKDISHWDSNTETYEDPSYKIEDPEKDSNDKGNEDFSVKYEDLSEAEKQATEYDENTKRNGTDAYTCIQCQLSFPSESKIRQHVREAHLVPGKGMIGSLRCHLCLFEAESPLQLQSHLIEHTFAGCTALSCYICQSLFTAPIGLQNHMLQEHGLGARPYDCSKCTLKFFFRAELDHHVITFHRVTDSKLERMIREERRNFKEGKDESDITIKKEDEDEEVNVDVHVEEENNEKRTEETPLKTEIDEESSDKTES